MAYEGKQKKSKHLACRGQAEEEHLARQPVADAVASKSSGEQSTQAGIRTLKNTIRKSLYGHTDRKLSLYYFDFQC